MHAPSIRPRSAIEIVDAAVSLYRDNFKTMAVIGLAASVPAVGGITLGLGMFGALSHMSRFMSNPLTMMPGIVAFSVVMILWFAVIDGAMTYAAAEAYHGRAPTPADAIRGVLGKGVSLVGGNLLRMLIVFGLAMVAAITFGVLGKDTNPVVALVVGVGVFVIVIHLLARTFAITSAIVIEGQSATEGVQRSFFLSKNDTMRIVGVALLCLVIYWLAQMIGVMLVQSVVRIVLRNTMLSMILGNIAGMIIYPFLNIAIMVLYYDQRVRKEGYDLDVLSSTMPAAAPR
jgi:hypothetical protein